MELFNTDIEMSFLGCLLMDNNLIVKSKSLITENDFYGENNKKYYTYILKQAEANNKIDIMTMSNDFNCEDFLKECISKVQIIDMYDAYAKIIKYNSKKRKMLKVLEDTKNTILNDNIIHINEVMMILQKDITTINSEDIDFEYFDLNKELDKRLNEIEEKRHLENYELPTGYKDLDDVIGGLHRKELLVIGARTSQGKSAFLMSIANNIIKLNKRTLIVSLEMSKEMLIDRYISMNAKVKNSLFRLSKFMTIQDWQNINNATPKMKDKPLFIVDKNIGTNQIFYEIEKYKPDVVMIDFLQQMSFESGKFENYALYLNLIMAELKTMAMKYNLAMVVASQLNRELYNRPDKTPRLSDLKSSGGIEQSADTILLLNWLFRNNPNRTYSEEEKKIIEILIEKQRNGQVGKITLKFEGDYVSFENLNKGGFYEQK